MTYAHEAKALSSRLSALEKRVSPTTKATTQPRDEIGRFGQGGAPQPSLFGDKTTASAVDPRTRSRAKEQAYQDRRTVDAARHARRGTSEDKPEATPAPAKTLFGDKPTARASFTEKPTERDLFGVPSFARPDAWEREGMYADNDDDDYDKRLFKYRPDQERDDHGRFEDEGGGGGTGGGGSATGKPGSATGGQKAPRKPKAPKAPETPPESGWERAGRYGLNALNVAALASIPFMIPGVGGAVAGLGSRAARAVGLGGRARPISAGAMPAGILAREQARLKGMYGSLDALAAKEAGIMREMAHSKERAEQAQRALAGGQFLDPISTHSIKRQLAESTGRFSALSTQLAETKAAQAATTSSITDLERALRGAKSVPSAAPPAPSLFSRITGRG